MKKFYILLISFFIVGISHAQWIQQESGTIEDLKSVFFADQNIGYVVGKNGVLLKTIDGGNNWTNLIIPGSNLGSVYFINQLTGFVTSSDGLYKTIDGGQQWSLLDFGCSSIQFLNENIGYGRGLDFSKTIDGGENWTSIYDEHFEDIFFITEDTGFAVASSGYEEIYYTCDGGMSWTSKSTGYEPPGVLCYNMRIYFLNSTTGFLTINCDYFNPILKTIDGGENWIEQTYSGSLSDMCFSDPNTGFILVNNIEYGDILVTNDGGESWDYMDSGNTNYLRDIHFPTPDTGYIVGNEGTILKNTSGGLVGNEEMNSSSSIYEFYPNPSKDKVTIAISQFDIHTQVTILNNYGQELINQVTTKNEMNIDLNHLASGIYFIKISNSNHTKTEILIKQ